MDTLIARIKGHWQLLALCALVFALWNWPVIFPLKMLVIFLHETSHGLAALLTGGSIKEMSLNINQGGHAVTVGGNAFLIISSGYLGSLLFGVLIFLVALRTSLDRPFMAALGVTIIAITFLYMKGRFPILFGLATGAAMLACARYLSHQINDLILRVIGLTSIIYVPYDIFSDTLARSHIRSDARILAEVVGGPTVMWGSIWLIISLCVIFAVLRYGLGPSSNLTFTKNEGSPKPGA